MNPSTDIEILNYLRSNFTQLSFLLPSSKYFTNKIKKHEKHLDNLFDFWLNDESYKRYRGGWISSVRSFLENIYLPNNLDYLDLEKMYVTITKKKIVRGTQGEVTNFVEEKQDDCHVCCEEINDHLSCGHWVCKSCIINSGKDTCPLCRKTVSLTLDEVRQLNKVNERMRQEKYEEERRQILQQIERQQMLERQRQERRQQQTSQEQIIGMIEYGLINYRGPFREIGLNLLRSWCSVYEMNNFSLEHPVYLEAIRIIYN